ncbi:type II toxin-antitoxin system RelE/ParE family toxin [Rhodoferax sp.]|uniref:type II toxin-antitoxin system RelE/ParE family toxin n=1 Tax=Rhodoferax sp. TaxID=50421 RepID=UPI00261F569C|nr:type II toxin-antitoxin system RelE/ParE family toxin [Rhodoferax sp.]MDD2809237.1 type II toxin-antitoxin system RelE/ParE family toxin [Rhodoferax sp.]MDD4945191.1 type II toxin-antitoxin system RelE/ParE family toxin [Rhodoferax sp.]
MATVLFAQSAQTDLLEAWLFIAEENLHAADRMLDTIEQEANVVATQPLMGRTRRDLTDDLRSWPTSTPYILYYKPQADGITIIRVLHHARDVQSSLF